MKQAIVIWAAMLFFGYRVLSEFPAGTVARIDFGVDCCWDFIQRFEVSGERR